MFEITHVCAPDKIEITDECIKKKKKFKNLPLSKSRQRDQAARLLAPW